jgi:archaellum component FlaF (FlaF/FlaG flagellin family)
MVAELQDDNLKTLHEDDADTLEKMETTTTLISLFQSGSTLQNAASTDVLTQGRGTQERPPNNGKILL